MILTKMTKSPGTLMNEKQSHAEQSYLQVLVDNFNNSWKLAKRRKKNKFWSFRFAMEGLN